MAPTPIYVDLPPFDGNIITKSYVPKMVASSASIGSPLELLNSVEWALNQFAKLNSSKTTSLKDFLMKFFNNEKVPIYVLDCNMFLLHEPEGCNEIASRGWMTMGPNHPEGEARGMKTHCHSPKGCNFIAPQGLM